MGGEADKNNEVGVGPSRIRSGAMMTQRLIVAARNKSV